MCRLVPAWYQGVPGPVLKETFHQRLHVQAWLRVRLIRIFPHQVNLQVEKGAI